MWDIWDILLVSPIFIPESTILKWDLGFLYVLDNTYPYLNISYKMLLWYEVEFDIIMLAQFTLISQTTHVVILNSKMNFHLCCVRIRQTFYMASHSSLWMPTATEVLHLLLRLFNGRIQSSDSPNYRGANTTVASFIGIHKFLISQQVSPIEREENYTMFPKYNFL